MEDNMRLRVIDVVVGDIDSEGYGTVKTTQIDASHIKFEIHRESEKTFPGMRLQAIYFGNIPAQTYDDPDYRMDWVPNTLYGLRDRQGTVYYDHEKDIERITKEHPDFKPHQFFSTTEEELERARKILKER